MVLWPVTTEAQHGDKTTELTTEPGEGEDHLIKEKQGESIWESNGNCLQTHRVVRLPMTSSRYFLSCWLLLVITYYISL